MSMRLAMREKIVCHRHPKTGDGKASVTHISLMKEEDPSEEVSYVVPHQLRGK